VVPLLEGGSLRDYCWVQAEQASVMASERGYGVLAVDEQMSAQDELDLPGVHPRGTSTSAWLGASLPRRGGHAVRDQQTHRPDRAPRRSVVGKKGIYRPIRIRWRHRVAASSWSLVIAGMVCWAQPAVCPAQPQARTPESPHA
jgi:hypothetical protein